MGDFVPQKTIKNVCAPTLIVCKQLKRSGLGSHYCTHCNHWDQSLYIQPVIETCNTTLSPEYHKIDLNRIKIKELHLIKGGIIRSNCGLTMYVALICNFSNVCLVLQYICCSLMLREAFDHKCCMITDRAAVMMPLLVCCSFPGPFNPCLNTKSSFLLSIYFVQVKEVAQMFGNVQFLW